MDGHERGTVDLRKPDEDVRTKMERIKGTVDTES